MVDPRLLPTDYYYRLECLRQRRRQLADPALNNAEASSTSAAAADECCVKDNDQLAKDWEVMFKDKKFADFTIRCPDDDGKMCQFLAHKLVLSARSPFFAALLEPHTEEARKSEVHFSDISAEVMDYVLRYMYTACVTIQGHTPHVHQVYLDLFEVADRFQLTSLRTIMCQFIRASLTNDNVCRVLVLADMHHEMDLKLAALRFFAKNSKEIIKTDGWMQMAKSYPQLVTDVVAELSEDGRDDSGLESMKSSDAQLIMTRFKEASSRGNDAVARFFADLRKTPHLFAAFLQLTKRQGINVPGEQLLPVHGQQ